MKVKIGNKIYDSKEEPIMIILEKREKELISNMGEQTKFCVHPGLRTSKYQSIKTIKEFMEISE